MRVISFMRRAFYILGGLGVALILTAVSLPWWLGGAARGLGGSRGLTFGRYETAGYGRFVLTDVAFVRPGFVVRAGRIDGQTPLVGLWARARGRPGEWRVDRWRVELNPSRPPAESSGPRGWLPLRSQLLSIKLGLQRWLPPTRSAEGEIVWDQGLIKVGRADWMPDGRLDFSGLAWRELSVSGRIDWPFEGDLSLELAQSDTDGFSGVIKSADPGSSLNGLLRFAGNEASWSASFAPSGWLPSELRLETGEWRLPADRLRLAPAYDAVMGALELTWKDERAEVIVQARAQNDQEADPTAPPLTLNVRAQGDFASLSLETFEIDAPGLTARLNQPVVIAQGGRLLSPDSRFTVSADLGNFPWMEAKGSIEGEVVLERLSTGRPLVTARLRGRDLSGPGWIVPALSGDGRLDWPRLEVTQSSLQLGANDVLSLVGSADLALGTLAGVTIEGRVSRQTLERWLPGELGFETATLEARVQGPWRSFEHEGQLAVEQLVIPRVAPLKLRVGWRGVGRVVGAIDGHLIAGTSRIDLEGVLQPDRIELSALRLRQGDQETLKLRSPTVVRWSPHPGAEPFSLDGPGGSIGGRFRYGEIGDLLLEANGISPSLLVDFLPGLSGLNWVVDSLRLEADWDRGPATFTGVAAGRLRSGSEAPADVKVSLRGDPEGIWVERAEVSVANEVALSARGRVPVTFDLFPSAVARLQEDAPLEIEAHSGVSRTFWTRLGELTGLQLQEPELDLLVSGTWRKPRGEATLRIARLSLAFAPKGFRVPPIDALTARWVGDGERVTLEGFTARVAGQAIAADVQLKLPAVREEWTKPAPWFWENLRASIRIPDADLTALSVYLPAWIGTGGRLSLDVAIAPGAQIAGNLSVRDASSRPLGPLGILHEIAADLEFAGRRLEVKRLEAKSGGQPVVVTGTAEWTDDGRLDLGLALKGENLPLVRRAGLLLRSDLDLRLSGGGKGEARVTGTVRLRDSLVLTDLRSLIPKGGPRGAPARRAPYFSIEAEPFARWALEIEVNGPRFLRLRTPVFSGLASARARLGGTLLEPRAVGEVTLDEGSVTLPFATFRVQQGVVSLTEANAFDPRIAVVAASRRFGYDLRMEVAGTVTSPAVTFSSSPPLDSAKVLLMVMAGEAPLDEVTYSGQQRIMRLGTYLGQSLLSRVRSDPARAERFSFTTGERVSRQGRETYGFEYPLDDRWSLVGEYDEFDEYNLGVKWRAFFEQPDPPEEKGEPKP